MWCGEIGDDGTFDLKELSSVKFVLSDSTVVKEGPSLLWYGLVGELSSKYGNVGHVVKWNGVSPIRELFVNVERGWESADESIW